VLILRGGRAEAFGPPKEVLRRVLAPKTVNAQPAASAGRPEDAAQPLVGEAV
jgi:hypothetical protein